MNPKNVIEYERWEKSSLMIWNGTSAQSRIRPKFIDGNLNAQNYHYDILIPKVQPFPAKISQSVRELAYSIVDVCWVNAPQSLLETFFTAKTYTIMYSSK